MYAYRCTRTYVRVHFALFRPTLSIKRGSSTKINKTLIILTLLFSCRFLLPNLQDGSSAVLIQIRRLRYRRRTCICDQTFSLRQISATLLALCTLNFPAAFSLTVFTVFAAGVYLSLAALLYYEFGNFHVLTLFASRLAQFDNWQSSFTANLGLCVSRALPHQGPSKTPKSSENSSFHTWCTFSLHAQGSTVLRFLDAPCVDCIRTGA